MTTSTTDGSDSRSSRHRLRRLYVDMPWGQVHVTMSGEGPPLLFVHSMPRSATEFSEVLGRIPGRASIAIDLPGLGGSDPLPDAPSIEAYATALWSVCDRMGLGPVPVVGHHGGGVVAVEMACVQPRRAEWLILSSTPWIGPTERAERGRNGIFYGFQPRDDLSHILRMAERRRPWMPTGRPELWDRLVVDVLRSPDPEAPLRAVAAYRMEDRIAMVTCPTLLLARRSDIWFEQRHMFSSRLTHSETHVIEGTVLVEDQPELLIAAVTSFLRRQHQEPSRSAGTRDS